jgi:Uma2 family endonuclease
MATSRATRALTPTATEIEYPESDGKPLGETGIHVEVTLTSLEVLRRYYTPNPRVAILSNMFVYYVEGDPKSCICPDLFVVLGVPSNPRRRTFKVWEEGKGPDWVLEVTSRKTRRDDQRTKLEIYRDVLKVREYFLFDPLEEYLEPSLQGSRLVRAQYKPIAPVAGRLPSEILGLHLERDDLDLRLYNPETGLWVPTSVELLGLLQESRTAHRRERAARRKEEEARRKEEQARRKEEGARRKEEEARRAAESEVERLRRENDALRRRLSE